MFDHLWLDRSSVLYEDQQDMGWILLGIPFDSTETHIPGQRFGPDKIRDILKHKDCLRLLDDYGNIIPSHGNVNEMIRRISEVVEKAIGNKKKGIFLGGEHSITYGILKGYFKVYKRIQIILFDAHYDMKESEHTRITHDSFLRRIIEDFDVDVWTFGVRRYEKEEKRFALKHTLKSVKDLKKIPTYISIDLDYFDLPLSQGCADKESEGYSINDFFNIFNQIVNNVGKENIVGIDIVELNPLLDSNLVTATLAADLLIKMIEILSNKNYY